MAVDQVKRSYRNGRKDQLEVDYSILMDEADKLDTKEDLMEFVESRLKLISSRLTSENVNELKDEHGLL